MIRIVTVLTGLTVSFSSASLGWMLPFVNLDDVNFPLEQCTHLHCAITNSTGGMVAFYTTAADILNDNKNSMLIIDGLCESACSLMAEQAIKHVCITPKAVFGFHKGINKLSHKEIDLSAQYSGFVNGWINNFGGWPSNDKIIRMPYDVARMHWRICQPVDFDKGAYDNDD